MMNIIYKLIQYIKFKRTTLIKENRNGINFYCKNFSIVTVDCFLFFSWKINSAKLSSELLFNYITLTTNLNYYHFGGDPVYYQTRLQIYKYAYFPKATNNHQDRLKDLLLSTLLLQ